MIKAKKLQTKITLKVVSESTKTIFECNFAKFFQEDMPPISYDNSVHVPAGNLGV